jgi:hypothetical protein
MVQQYRVPGPLGLSPSTNGGRIPGPLRTGPGSAAPPPATKAAKSFKMPPPMPSSTSKDVHEYRWKLYVDKTPELTDVWQGEIANCPLAALLAALAYTKVGKEFIHGLVGEFTGVVETDVTDVAGNLENAPKDNKVITDRYYTVKLGGRTWECSNVFYTNDSDRDWSLIYMQSNSKVLWPSVIEKAYAVKEGGYGALDTATGKKLTVEDIWEGVVGKKPAGFQVTASTTDDELKKAANAAKQVPTIAASKTKTTGSLTAWHGFAVLGMKGAEIELYDPGQVDRVTQSLKQFRENFQAVRYGGP